MRNEEIRQIVSEEIESKLLDYPTKDDLKNEFKSYPTKEDLKNELKAYPTKEDLKNELKAYPTKDDLRNELKAYATKVDLKTEISGLETRVQTQFNHMQGQIDDLRTDMNTGFETVIQKMDFYFEQKNLDKFDSIEISLDNHEKRIARLETDL